MRQNQNAVTQTTVSISMFVFGSTLFFLIGCACMWLYGHKYKIEGLDKNTHFQAALLYEDLQPPTSMPGDQEKTFEMNENVAYGPINTIQSSRIEIFSTLLNISILDVVIIL